MELKTYFAQDRNGSLIPGATVTIYLTGTTTLATGLKTVGGNALANPFTADADGKIQFRAPDGMYDMQVSVGTDTGTRVTFQCVDIGQQLSDANGAAERAESAAQSAQEAAESLDLSADDAYTKIGGLQENFEPARIKRIIGKTFATGANISTANQALFDEATGLNWIWAGTLPKTVAAGETPTGTSWICVGLLNGNPINRLDAWCDVIANNDITSVLRIFFTSMKYFGLQPILIGKGKITDLVDAYDTPYDASGFTLTIPLNYLSSSALNNGYLLHTSEPNTQVVTGFDPEFNYMRQDTSAALTQFGDCTFAWEAEDVENDKAYLRSNGQVILKTGICVSTVTDRAIFRSTPNLYIVNGTVKAYIKPLANRITIKLPRVELTGSYLDENKQLEQIFLISRNNVEVVGSKLNSAVGSQVKVRALISVQRCASVVITGVVMSGSIMNYEYGVSYFNVAELTVRESTFLRGWAFIDGNFARNTLVERCVIAGKFGGHIGVWDFTVRGCKLYPINLAAVQATGGLCFAGGGTVLMENNEYFYTGGNHAEENFFGTRQDYGQAHEGDVIIRDNTVWYNASDKVFNAVYLAGAYPSTMDYTRPYCFFGNKIVVDNIRFRPATANLPAASIQFRPVGFSRAANWTMRQRFPDEVTISNISAYNFDGTSGGLRMTLDLPGYQTDATRWAAGTFNINVEKCDLRGGISYTAVTPSTSEPLIAQNITIRDCIGNIGLVIGGRNETWKLQNLSLDNVSSNSSTYSAINVYINDCKLKATTCGSNAPGDKWHYTGNFGEYVGTLNIGSRAVYCKGNTIAAGSSLTGRTYAEWFDYRDSTVFRTA